jgi:hypothetical protein
MKTITVKDETHARLTKVGMWGETMDAIISRLLDCVEGVKRDEVMG